MHICMSSLQSSRSGHVIGSPWQAPPMHASLTVQNCPSSHGAPLPLAGFEQFPLFGLHVPTSWQASRAVQVVWTPVQVPPTQASFDVHLLPSSHAVPFDLGVGAEHWPVPGSQAPALLH